MAFYNILETIFILLFSISIIFGMIYFYFVPIEDIEERPTKTEKEIDSVYLTLQNMTTDEILLFKNKKDFMKTIEGLDTIKYFLKGTEEENIDKLIGWYYKGYKKL